MKKRLTLTFWGMLVAFSVMAEAVKVTSPDGDGKSSVSCPLKPSDSAPLC